jgi:limonene-1,2-epoxide hydrolase
MFVYRAAEKRVTPRDPPRAVAAIALALALAACGGGANSSGGSDSSTVPGGANVADVDVIQAWVAALDRGDLDAAASYFAIPSVAENGPLLLHITTRGEARAFNATLPCGARVVRASSAGNFTTATFRLGERPGPGSCGPGSGSLARTAFVIRDGKIVQWRRVGAGGGPKTPSPTV